MKSLDIIQKICKVLKTLTKIYFIFCMVALALNLAGATVLFLIKEDSVLWQEIIKLSGSEGANIALARCGSLSSVFTFAISAVAGCFANRFFADEVAAGTPFDRTICKKMLREGIVYISLAVLSGIVATIVYACFDISYNGMDYVEFDSGLVFIACSFMCRYGADVKEIADKKIAESNYADFADCADCRKTAADEKNTAADEKNDAAAE